MLVSFYLFIYLFFCSEFCHTLKWNSHGFTCVPHPDPPSHLPLHSLPLGLPSAPGPRACLMNEYSRLVSFKIDSFDLLAIQRTLKSLLQHHNLRDSVLWCSALFMVQLSHPSMTTIKNITLTLWTLVGKVTCLLFNMLSRFLTAFLPRSKHLLIMWLLSPPSVILEPKKIKSQKKKKKISTVWTFLPFICYKLMGMNAMVLVSWMFNFKLAFWLSSFIFIKRLFNYSSLSAICGFICISEVVDISFDNLDTSFWFIQLGVIWSVLIFFF